MACRREHSRSCSLSPRPARGPSPQRARSPPHRAAEPVHGEEQSMRVVILAGGKGTRLQPYTTVLPKPLMPIGDLPILEVELRQLRHFGFEEVTIAVGHLANLIMALFGDGGQLGLRIR